MTYLKVPCEKIWGGPIFWSCPTILESYRKSLLRRDRELLMIVAECNWTLEIMQKSLLKVYSLKWMHRGVNERVFALLIVDRRKWMRILR